MISLQPPSVDSCRKSVASLAIIPEDVRDLVEHRKNTIQWQKVNSIERMLAEHEQVNCPLKHIFTPVPNHPELHLYSREITMPAGMLLTSHIHLFEHPFIISSGVCSVWSNDTGWETFRSPYRGVTLPATRRILYIHEETVWTTFHVTMQTDPDLAVEEISISPFNFGHLEGLSAEKRQALENNCRETKLTT